MIGQGGASYWASTTGESPGLQYSSHTVLPWQNVNATPVEARVKNTIPYNTVQNIYFWLSF